MSDKKIQCLFLAAILIFAAFVAYIPHINYPFPLHVDEWFHITIADEIARTNSFLTEDPFTGKLSSNDLEIGYHLFLAGIQKLTGLGIKIPVILPSILAIISVLCVFLLAKRWGNDVAYISAILTALIPSNVTIGGPSLLLPLNLSLIFIPLSLFIVYHAKNFKHYILLFAINVFILFSHPLTIVPIFLLLFVYAILNLKEDRKKSGMIFLSMILSFLIVLPRFIPAFSSKGIGAVTYSFWGYVQMIPPLFGYVPIAFFFIGFYFLTQSKRKEDWTILIGVIIFLLVILFYINTGWLLLFSYHRTYMPLFILMVMVAGYGLSKIKIKPVIAIILLIAIALSLQQHFSEQYYHVIDEREYQDFLWIRDNTQKDAIVLLDPWKARALPAIAERKVLSVTPFGPNTDILDFNKEITNFLDSNCSDTQFLRQYNVSVVYSENGCKNEDLIKVRERIYTIKG